MMLLNAYSAVEEKFLCNETKPVTAFGDHAYIWGVEYIKGGFNCCTISAREWNTSISMYFMDWVPKPNTWHNDFYGNEKSRQEAAF